MAQYLAVCGGVEVTWVRVKEEGNDGARGGKMRGGRRRRDGESYDRRAFEIVNGGRQLTNVGVPWVVMSVRNGSPGWSGRGWRRQGVEGRG